jgi:hypothetical protein
MLNVENLARLQYHSLRSGTMSACVTEIRRVEDGILQYNLNA